jgi:hypothetical protein
MRPVRQSLERRGRLCFAQARGYPNLMRRATTFCVASFAMGCLLAGAGCQGAAGGASLADGATVSPSPTLRQGQEAVSLVFTRAAGGLDAAAAFDLGGLVIARQPQSTDTRLVLGVSVPHGVALGARTLTFSDAGGAVSVPNVVEVGAITSGPAGSDTNLGTSAAPFRTVKRAVAAAGAGDTLQLSDGAYDATAGETWSYTLPANLTIVGQSMAGTNLTGPLVGGAITPGTIGFLAPAGLTVKTLTLSAFDTAISATGPGAVTLDDLAVTNASTAAVRADAAGVTVTVTGGTLSAEQDAILLGDSCMACALAVTSASLVGGLMDGHTIEISAMAAGSRAVLQEVDVRGDTSVLAPTATLSVSGSTIMENGPGAQSMINFAGQALDVTTSTITLNADNFGINFGGQTLMLAGVTIEGGHYGIYQLSGSAKLRGSHIRDYGYIGYYLAQGDLDLGTATEAGDDAFSSSATGATVFGLYVDGITHPVTSSNTTFNGVEPPAGTQAAAPDQMIAVPGEYVINYGKAISFWTL